MSNIMLKTFRIMFHKRLRNPNENDILLTTVYDIEFKKLRLVVYHVKLQNKCVYLLILQRIR